MKSDTNTAGAAMRPDKNTEEAAVRSAAGRAGKSPMKITAGLGCIDEYIPYVNAGADEVFCGFVPYEWRRAAGVLSPLNRREVLNVNVQIGSESELRILKKMEDHYGIPVVITLNSPFYDPALYPEVLKVIRTCVSCGFREFIAADPGLIFKIRAAAEAGDDGLSGVRLRVSGEFGEMNRYVLGEFRRYHVSGKQRKNVFLNCSGEEKAVSGDDLPEITGIIFHRKVPIRDMAALTAAFPEFQYEAFALNEMCHFSGGFCCSLHCDELPHMCLVPWKIGHLKDPAEAEKKNRKNRRNSENSADPAARKPDAGTDGETESGTGSDAAAPLPGSGGCGLCALYRLREAGIGRLKLVSRGEAEEDTVRDIRVLKTALRILKESGSEEKYVRKMKAELFPKGCSGNCYYREAPNLN